MRPISSVMVALPRSADRPGHRFNVAYRRARHRREAPKGRRMVDEQQSPVTAHPHASHPLRRSSPDRGHHDGVKCSTSRIAKGVDVRADGGRAILVAGGGLYGALRCALWRGRRFSKVSLQTLHRPCACAPASIRTTITAPPGFIEACRTPAKSKAVRR